VHQNEEGNNIEVDIPDWDECINTLINKSWVDQMAHLACYQSCKRPSWGYSEQKNCLIKGQISLVRQITAQLTKVNPWEIIITKLDILSVAVLNNTHSASVVEFILTLQWDPSNPDHEIIMW